MLRRSLVVSREMAQTEIRQGRVTVDGAPALKPARLVGPGENIELLGPPARFVSRAGLKLDAALDAFGIDPARYVCLDAGSSTGGFTDCLLQRKARKVYAVDVGTNQLHESIRDNVNVIVRERTDIRKVDAKLFDEPLDFVVGDLSFISLRLVMPSLFALVEPGVGLVLLVKPQFEAGRQEAAKGKGVITDPAIWLRVLDEVASEAASLGAEVLAVAPSPVTGRTGNVEFALHLKLTAVTNSSYNRQRLAEAVAIASAQDSAKHTGLTMGKDS